jgi:hypothetical protein
VRLGETEAAKPNIFSGSGARASVSLAAVTDNLCVQRALWADLHLCAAERAASICGESAGCSGCLLHRGLRILVYHIPSFIMCIPAEPYSTVK